MVPQSQSASKTFRKLFPKRKHCVKFCDCIECPGASWHGILPTWLALLPAPCPPPQVCMVKSGLVVEDAGEPVRDAVLLCNSKDEDVVCWLTGGVRDHGDPFGVEGGGTPGESRL